MQMLTNPSGGKYYTPTFILADMTNDFLNNIELYPWKLSAPHISPLT